MNWRPDKNQWEKTRCDLCFENECEGDDCEACREVYEAGASAMLAARDKWWLGLLQEVNEANDLKDLQERFAHLLRYVADLGIKREVGQ